MINEHPKEWIVYEDRTSRAWPFVGRCLARPDLSEEVRLALHQIGEPSAGRRLWLDRRDRAPRTGPPHPDHGRQHAWPMDSRMCKACGLLRPEARSR